VLREPSFIASRFAPVNRRPLAASSMRTNQPRPIDRVLGLPLDLTGFCAGLRGAARALYTDDPDLGEVLKKEAARLEYLKADRACIETDHPSLPPEDAPAAAFVEWRSRVWQEGSALAHALARADQVLGREQLIACFKPAASGPQRG
jgi:hypothetical protein